MAHTLLGWDSQVYSAAGVLVSSRYIKLTTKNSHHSSHLNTRVLWGHFHFKHHRAITTIGLLVYIATTWPGTAPWSCPFAKGPCQIDKGGSNNSTWFLLFLPSDGAQHCPPRHLRTVLHCAFTWASLAGRPPSHACLDSSGLLLPGLFSTLLHRYCT